jgi:hypothetical protein
MSGLLFGKVCVILHSFSLLILVWFRPFRRTYWFYFLVCSFTFLLWDGVSAFGSFVCPHFYHYLKFQGCFFPGLCKCEPYYAVKEKSSAVETELLRKFELLLCGIEDLAERSHHVLVAFQCAENAVVAIGTIATGVKCVILSRTISGAISRHSSIRKLLPTKCLREHLLGYHIYQIVKLTAKYVVHISSPDLIFKISLVCMRQTLLICSYSALCLRRTCSGGMGR